MTESWGTAVSPAPPPNTLIAGATNGPSGHSHSGGPGRVVPHFRHARRGCRSSIEDVAPDDAVVTCDLCGRQETDPVRALAWTTAVERGVRKTFCLECSRDNLRAMEGKLDSEWW